MTTYTIQAGTTTGSPAGTTFSSSVRQFAGVVAGDVVLLAETYPSEVWNFTSTLDAAAGNPIVVQGAGQIIDAGDYDGRPCLRSDGDYYEFHDLVLRNTVRVAATVSHGLMMNGLDHKATNITCTDLGGYGVYMGSANGYLKGFYISDVGDDGIRLNGTVSGSTIITDGAVIDPDQDGLGTGDFIQALTGATGTISVSWLYGNQSLAGWNKQGFQFTVPAANVVLHDIVMVGPGAADAGANQGCQFSAVTDATVHRLSIERFSARGVAFTGTSGGCSGVASLVGNIVRKLDAVGGSSGIALRVAADNNAGAFSFAQNSVYDCSGGIHLDDTFGTATVYNNIAYRRAETSDFLQCFKVELAAEEGSVTSDNNCWYSASGTDAVVQWGGVNYDTLAAYQAAESGDQNSIGGDPQFLDPEDGDLRLNGSSPCKEAGTRWWETNPPPQGQDGLRFSRVPAMGAYQPSPHDGATRSPLVLSAAAGVYDAGVDIAKVRAA